MPAFPNVMKTILWILMAVFALSYARSQEIPPDIGEGIAILPVGKLPKNVPLFFSATAEVEVKTSLRELYGTQKITFRVHQGKPEMFTLGLSGKGEVRGVSGDNLRDWSVRGTPDGGRILEIRPLLAEGPPPAEFTFTVVTLGKVEKGIASIVLPTPGAATGFSMKLNLIEDAGMNVGIARAEGLEPVAEGGGKKFVATGASSLEMRVNAGGSRGVDVLEGALTGRLSADGGSVSFRFDGRAKAIAAGSSTELLGGAVAISEGVSGEGWHLAIRKQGENYVYEVVADREGEMAVSFGFEASLARRGDWRALDFRMPGGVIVPVRIEGVDASVSFDRGLPVVPVRKADAWEGFLPVSGNAKLAWRSADIIADGALFFSSTEASDIRVGNGLLRQMTTMDFRILQGKLPSLSLAMEGPGEVLAVTGEPVLAWSVKEAGGKRSLEITLSRPIENSTRIRVDSQSALGGFPVKTQPLRLIPGGALRHSGWIRVANDGAVRIEVADASGLIQLAPAQFPGGADESLRQVFVYRFPSAEYGYTVLADQVLPEVGVTEVTVYELAETDRRIFSDIELDIREAPLREWEMEIPADHAVASVTGAAVADYVVASEVTAGKRRLKLLFKQPVSDRQLVSVRLEKNEAAKAGAWELSPLGFPGAKSRRGYIGAVAAAGYRLVAGAGAGVAEVPLTFFPKKVPGLQQAFRLKEGEWKMGLSVEALGQSVQADVFHLYSLKSGAAYGSVLMNFFVVGAPATEWRVSVPATIGNIDVSGQNVGRDWRREGDVVIVPLSRPVIGAGTILLTFEQPMSARGGEISPGEVRPLNVQGERGYVQVVSPLQVNYDISRSEGALLALDASELPAEFRLLSTSPTLGAWQYTARDFNIGMKVEWFEPGDTVGQVVDFLKLESRVSKDGQWVTDARFFVKSKGRSGLRMRLPEGAVLWDAKVAGVTVNARKDGAETLIPLPSGGDPNQAVEIALRYGANSQKAGRPKLSSPVLDSPVVIGEWTVSGDQGRVLIPEGGNAQLVHQGIPETGWAWIGRQGMVLFGVAAGIVGMVLFGRRGGLRLGLGIGCALIALFSSVMLLKEAALDQPAYDVMLEYAAPVVKAGTPVTVEVANVSVWRAGLGWAFWLLLVAGVISLVAAALLKIRPLGVLALMLVGAGLLSMRGGAAVFFGLLIVMTLAWWIPVIRSGIRTLRGRRMTPAVTASFIMASAFFFQMGDARAQEKKTAESIIQQWSIHEGRLKGGMEIAVRGEAGDRFLLLQAPAVLSKFEGAGLKLVKARAGDADAYFVELDAPGRFSGTADFEMPLADPAKGWTLPGGPAVLRQVTVRWDEAGWEFHSPQAAKVSLLEGLAPNESGALLVLGALDQVTIQARPKQRDTGAEETKFFAEVSNFFLPGPGVVGGRHQVALRPSQGRVSSLTMKVPEGFTVSDVTEGPIGSWRYDPAKRELRVALEPAQEQAFTFTVETQRGAGALPVDLTLEPLRVLGAAGEVGLLGLGFGEEAQPESIETEGLSRVNPEDFNADANRGKEKAVKKEKHLVIPVQHAFRYGTAEAKLKVKVSAVAPELRAESWQLVSLGEDRLVIATDLIVTITRSGVFRLAVSVPEGLEIESASGEGLSHWTENGKGADRIVTLHLSGKTMGRQVFSLTLSGATVNTSVSWEVPRISLRGASRETGVLTVVPDRGLQVRVASRRNVSPIDPRELASGKEEAAKAAVRPGALAYRLLQGDWSLGLGLSKLDPWVTARVFHDTTLREGQSLSRVSIGYKIENSALKSLRVRIPGLDAEAAGTVRATGNAVADFAPVAGEEGLWEIRFQRGIAGETKVDLEYQRRTASGTEAIQPVVLEQVRQLSYFAAVRAGGRLEIEAGAAPRGWQRADWSVVQAALGADAGQVAPLLAYRVADPEGPLPVVLKRHDLAGLRKLRVASGVLTSLVSPAGDALTAVDLRMDVSGKSTLRLRLPTGADLFNVLVNDEGANLVREGDEWLFYVFPSPDATKATSVRFVYSAGTGKGERLEGPRLAEGDAGVSSKGDRLNVPMENLTWRVLVPAGWKLSSHGGDFDLQDEVRMGLFRLEDYQSFVSSKREVDAQGAVEMLDQANAYLKDGDQERASVALSNAIRGNQLDEASNEDARVQLRQLKTQQAVLGLNTRRQKLVLDNRGEVPQDNGQLEKAAEANPVLRGVSNFDPKDFDRFTAGNTADENAALKEIANRIVSQQLAAEPAPAALDVTLPERGTVVTFGRSVQVDGDRAMAIEIDLEKESKGGWWVGLLGVLALGLLAGRKRLAAAR